MILPIRICDSARLEFRTRILQRSLTSGVIDSRLLYETSEQANKWMAIHQKYSPINMAGTFEIYEYAFREVCRKIKSRPTTIISLGCGSGSKDVRLIRELINTNDTKDFPIKYVPSDISETLAMSAANQVHQAFPNVVIQPVATDLSEASRCMIDFQSIDENRIVLFFGILPSIERRKAFQILKSIYQPTDFLLMSANLAPGGDYLEGVKQVLPQYDNAETKDWLLSFWETLKVSKVAGNIDFEIGNEMRDEQFHSDLMRIQAIYRFVQSVSIEGPHGEHRFDQGDKLRLLISNRYTESHLRELMKGLNISNSRTYISKDGQEGVVSGAG